MPSNTGMAKDKVVHTHSGISLSHKKGKIAPCAAPWMDLETITLSKASQTEKDSHHMISLICGI